jgi:transposase-like protein
METEIPETARKKRKKLTPQEKWQIFQETSVKEAPVGEILRRYGAYSSELTKIRRQVEDGALKELGANRHAKKTQSVPYKEYAKLQAELMAKEKALAQMSEEYLILKKRVS